MPDIGGVVHTHSTYATAWASRGEAIPCVLTMMADEFGGEIPIAPFALIGGEEIGKAIVETLRDHRSNAVLLKNHGVFAIGKTAREAVKAAVMCEDVARSVHIARQLGSPQPILPADIDALYDRYQNEYGQRPANSDRTGHTMTSLISSLGSRTRSREPGTRRDLVPHRQPVDVRRGHLAPGGVAVEDGRRAPDRRGVAARGDRVEAGPDRFGDDSARLPRRRTATTAASA